MFKNGIRKALASVLVFMTVLLSIPLDSLAINEQFDDPNDDLVSQNEQFLDLLNEEQPDKPKVSASAYVLIDSDSGDIICGSDYDKQMQPASTESLVKSGETVIPVAERPKSAAEHTEMAVEKAKALLIVSFDENNPVIKKIPW